MHLVSKKSLPVYPPFNSFIGYLETYLLDEFEIYDMHLVPKKSLPVYPPFNSFIGYLETYLLDEFEIYERLPKNMK